MLPKIRSIIIDDEPKAIELLRQRLGILFPDLQIAATFTEWENALEEIRRNPPDILFLDISMPQKSGLDFLKLFQKVNFQVIFITAHANYALDAIKLSAIGYVLKPIDDLELSFAINKAIEKIRPSREAVTVAQNNGNFLKIGVPNASSAAKGIDYIRIDEIIYFESVKKYTKVVTKTYSVMSSYNLAEFKKLLPESQFFQTHRAFIVNLGRVKRYEIAGSLYMEDDAEIPISRQVRQEFVTVFNQMNRTVGFKNKDLE